VNNKNTLVELDAILDTRLAMAYLLDKTSVEKITTDGSYYTRIKDNYGYISKDIFTAFYKRRTKDLLTLGLPTPIFDILKEHYGEIITDEINDEYEEDILIYVNIYPYNLNEDEKNNIIKSVQLVVPKSKVKTISLSKKELTPDWIDHNVGTLIMYEGLDWLDYHMSNNNLIKKPLLTTLLISPAISTGSTSTKEIKKDTFKDLMLVASTLIDLVLVDAVNFSRIQE